MTGARTTTYPAFTTIRFENGVWRLRLSEGLASWFKCVLFLLPFVVAGSTALGVRLIYAHWNGATGWWPGFPIAAGELACGLILLICLFTFFAAIGVLFQKGEVLFDGKFLRLRDRGSAHDIPADQIRNIRQVSCGRTTVYLDTGGHPSHVFYRDQRTALEIETVEGRIEFFRICDPMTITWLAENLRRLVLNQDPVDPEAALPERTPGAVISTSIYGPQRRQLARYLVAFGIVASLAAGWFTHIAWSSRHWPQVQGHVLKAEYRQYKQDNETRCTADISYAYTVNGHEYTNDDIGISRSPWDEDVKAVVVAHPRGTPVTVYFDLSKPSRSLLLPGLNFDQTFWSILAALPFVGALPLLLRPTTPAQDALAARYKVDVRRTADADPSSTVTWRVPDEVCKAAVRSGKWSAVWMSVRINAFAGLSVWLAHHFLAHVIGPEISWRFITLAMLGFPALMIFAAVVDVFMAGRRRAPEYGVSDKGILIPSRDHPVIRWKRIASFTVQPHPELPAFQNLVLHLKDGRTRRISLPAGDLDPTILRRVSAEIPQSPPPPNARPLKPTDWMIGLAITAAATWTSAMQINPHLRSPHAKDTVPWLFVAACILGPGTWLALFLRHRRAPQQRMGLAVSLNMIAMLGLMLLLVVLHARIQ
jgi:uncharacterized protein DUF3592